MSIASRVYAKGLWETWVNSLPTEEADAFINAENDLIDGTLSHIEGIVTEYHLFIESGGEIVLPMPKHYLR